MRTPGWSRISQWADSLTILETHRTRIGKFTPALCNNAGCAEIRMCEVQGLFILKQQHWQNLPKLCGEAGRFG